MQQSKPLRILPESSQKQALIALADYSVSRPINTRQRSFGV